MISLQKLIKMAKKWRRFAATTRRRISLPKAPTEGYFVVYTIDQRRFVLPIMYLTNQILIELLKFSEDEFGIPRDGPIVVPIEAIYMDYVVFLIENNAGKEMIEALLESMTSSTARSGSLPCYIHQERHLQQLPLCSF